MSHAAQPPAQARRDFAHHAEVDEGEAPGRGAGVGRALEGRERRRFRGAWSAWKKPSSNSWSNITRAKRAATSEGSMPARGGRRTVVDLDRGDVLEFSTRRVVRSPHTTSGTATPSGPPKSAAKRSELAASCR